MNYLTLKFPSDSIFLVTGGAGFIGSNLCEAILSMGCKVRCLDNLSSGKLQYAEMFLHSPNYKFIEGDIKDFATCVEACTGVDYVLHEAAGGSVPRSIEKPQAYCADNITGTLNMLEAARQNNVKKFVYASSASVYGDDPSDLKVEGREGVLFSPYALTKRCDEEWAKQYTMHYRLDTHGLRYFNVYGRRQNPDGDYAAVIPKFVKQLLNGERPTINSDGTQTRDFVYVEDVVQANLKACLAPQEAAGEVFNIAYGNSQSLTKVYKIISEQLGLHIEPFFGPERIGDIKHSGADISKAKQILCYTPKYDFARGLKEAISWYRDNL